MIMKHSLLPLCLFLTLLTDRYVYGQPTALPAQLGPHQWTATIKVIGEDGNPIAGADASFQYSVPTQPGSGQPTYAEIKGITDASGTFTASHTDSSWNLGFTAEKSGYYRTHIGHRMHLPGEFDAKITANGNPIFTLMLKQIGKPIAMYAKQITELTFPVFNKAIGYDLMAGDWVAPYGKGLTTDFLFTANHANAQAGYTFTVSFPNPGDGIQEFTRDWSLGVSDFDLTPEKETGQRVSLAAKERQDDERQTIQC